MDPLNLKSNPDLGRHHSTVFLKSHPLFFLQVARGRWPFRASRGSSLRARLHERRGLQPAVPDLPPLHLRARVLRLGHPSHSNWTLFVCVRERWPRFHATETCATLLSTSPPRFFKPSHPSPNPLLLLQCFGRIAAKVERVFVSCFEFFQLLALPASSRLASPRFVSLAWRATVSLFRERMVERSPPRGAGNFRMQSGYIRTRECGEMEILNNCRWNRLDKNGSGYD